MASERLASLARKMENKENNKTYIDATLMPADDKIAVIERDMEMALASGEFKVYYQSKHSPTTGKLTGAEALIRWEHHDLGLLKPSDFIPIFETNGFIRKTDEFVRQQVCNDLTRWKQNGYRLVPISLNMSRLDFDNRDVADEIIALVNSKGIDHSLLCFEITETAFVDNQNMIIRAANILRNEGFGIAIDDFGSGFSSFSMLGSIPMNSLKIDKAMLDDLRGDKQRFLLDTCIKLGQKFNAETEAEGVETREQLNLLRELNCDKAQGFYFSQPMPVEIFEKRLVDNWQ